LERLFKLNISSVDVKIHELFDTHKDLRLKILTNREKLFAHTDGQYMAMLYSKKSVERIETHFGIEASELLSRDIILERITPDDLVESAVEIKEILNKIDDIWNEVIASDKELEGNLFKRQKET
jgi:hypothetical protein